MAKKYYEGYVKCVHLKHFEWCAERGIPRDPYSPSYTMFKGYGE